MTCKAHNLPSPSSPVFGEIRSPDKMTMFYSELTPGYHQVEKRGSLVAVPEDRKLQLPFILGTVPNKRRCGLLSPSSFLSDNVRIMDDDNPQNHDPAHGHNPQHPEVVVDPQQPRKGSVPFMLNAETVHPALYAGAGAGGSGSGQASPWPSPFPSPSPSPTRSTASSTLDDERFLPPVAELFRYSGQASPRYAEEFGNPGQPRRRTSYPYQGTSDWYASGASQPPFSPAAVARLPSSSSSTSSSAAAAAAAAAAESSQGNQPYTEEQLDYLLYQHEDCGISWKPVASRFNRYFGEERSEDGINSRFYRDQYYALFDASLRWLRHEGRPVLQKVNVRKRQGENAGAIWDMRKTLCDQAPRSALKRPWVDDPAHQALAKRTVAMEEQRRLLGGGFPDSYELEVGRNRSNCYIIDLVEPSQRRSDPKGNEKARPYVCKIPAEILVGVHWRDRNRVLVEHLAAVMKNGR